MKNKMIGLIILALIVFTACDLFDPSAADSAIFAADRDNALDHDFWERKTTFPGDKRAEAVLFERDGLVYYGLGHHEDTDNPLLDMWTYNPESESWTEIEISGHETRDDDSCTTYEHDGKVYVVEGWNHDTVWEYDVDAGTLTLTTLDFSNIPASGLDCAWTDSCILFGTSDSYDYVYYSWYFDTADPVVTRQMSDSDYSGYRNPAFFTIGDKIYSGGGKYPVDSSEDPDDDGVDTNAVREFSEFDPADGSWVSIPSLPESAGVVEKGFSIDGTGYVLGDENKLYSWTPGDTEWTELASFPEGYFMDYGNSSFVLCDGDAYFLRQWTGFGDGFLPGSSSGYLFKYTP